MIRSIQVNLFWLIMPKRISKTTKYSKEYYIIYIRVLQTPWPSPNSKRFPNCNKWCQQHHYKFLLQLDFIKNMHRPNLWEFIIHSRGVVKRDHAVRTMCVKIANSYYCAILFKTPREWIINSYKLGRCHVFNEIQL